MGVIGKVIGIVGTPHSGKTVFVNQLYNYLRQLGVSFFVQSACPDGEGRWTASTDHEVVKKIRVKGKFDEVFIEHQKKAIQGLKENFQVVLLDLGGLPSKENEELLKFCDYYIFLKRPDKPELIQKWQELLDFIGHLKPLAVFDSIWQGEAVVRKDPKIFRGILVKLDRSGVPEDTREVIKSFAEYLKQKFGGTKIDSKFKIEVKDFNDFIFVSVVIGENGIIEVAELPELLRVVREAVGTKYYGKGVVISGRLPIWAHSAIAHILHPARFIAHFDPRLKGGVIVATHDPRYNIGQIIPINL
ncbi:MAG TPA: hypothetical protein ENF45_04320 [Bacteroidetes bacterium]|nr:hypothetical protein [Bacteroidota bacterium]